MKSRVALCAFSAAVLAAAAWSDVDARLAGHEPVIALPLLTGSGAFRMSPQEREALYNAQLRPARTKVLAREARQALLAEPLSPTAIWVLAAQQQDASTQGMLLLAEKVTRRELGVQMALFRLATEKGDLARGFAYLDRGLTIHPEAAPALLRGVLQALAEPDIRALFLPYAQRPWFSVLLRESASKAADGLTSAALITEAKLTKEHFAPGLLPLVLSRLIKEGEAYEAGQLAMRTGIITEAGLESFAITPETTLVEARPLIWQFVSNDAVSWKVQDGTKVEWTLEPGRSAVLTERVTLYRSGPYQLTQLVSGTDQRLLVVWELRCIDGDGERRVWSQPIPLQSNVQQLEVEVSIPSDCPAQRWTLKGSASDLQTAGSIFLEKLDLKIKEQS